MLKIVLCKDPIFSTRNDPDRVEWAEPKKEKMYDAVASLIKAGKSVSLSYGEHLFSDDISALNFLETIKQGSGEVTLYCKDLILPEILLKYAVIEREKSDIKIFAEKLEELPFSTAAKETIMENFKGFPFSRIEEILLEISQISEDEAVETVLENKRNLLRQDDVLEVVNIQDGIDQIGGLDDLKDWIVERKGNFSKKAQSFGIPMPKGMLMLGVQGCGKSLTSKVIANIWNFPLVRLDFINLFKKGRSVEELLRETVLKVESFAPIILWIDEIEKALSQEGEGAEIRRVLGWLVTWMQEKKVPVFLVATANRVALLPPELLRKGRFDEIFFVDLPSPKERKEIFSIHLKKRDRSPDAFNLDDLAELSNGFSGAEIEQVVIDALISSFSKKRDLHQKTIEEILRKTVPLSKTYEENIKDLRNWSRNRARNASGNRRIEAFFGK